jgi:uncharacterized protein YcfL
MNAAQSVPAVLLAGLLSIAGCASPPPGPSQPMQGPSAPGVLVITPALVPYLDVPNGQQNYSFNAAGLLEYSTVIRNKGSQPIALACSAYFMNDAGSVVEEQPLLDRIFVDPQTEKALRVAATNREAKKMRVQIQPAK